MKKLTSMLMIAALASSALALSEGQVFAKSRPVRAPHAITVKASRRSRSEAHRSRAKTAKTAKTSKTRKAHRRTRKAKQAPAPSMPQMG